MIVPKEDAQHYIYHHRYTHVMRCDLCGTERGITDPEEIPRNWLTLERAGMHRTIAGICYGKPNDIRHACCEIHAFELHINAAKQYESPEERREWSDPILEHYERIKEQCGGIPERIRLRVIPILMEFGWKKEGVYDPRNVVLAFPDEVDLDNLPPAWNTGLLDNTLDLQPDRLSMEPLDAWGWLQRAFN
jgi:hypothetical protein